MLRRLKIMYINIWRIILLKKKSRKIYAEIKGINNTLKNGACENPGELITKLLFKYTVLCEIRLRITQIYNEMFEKEEA